MESQGRYSSEINQEMVLIAPECSKGVTEVKVPEEEKVELGGRIIDGIYRVVKAFDSEKDKKGLFVGIVRHMVDGNLYVIKAMGGSKISMLHKEVASNQHLTKDSRFTVKMISFKLAQAGMGVLTLANGEEHTTYSYMVLKYYSNGSLLRVLMNSVKQSKPIPLSIQKKFCRQIVQGVAHIHQELGIAHLDLKADNFVVTDSYDLALIDFGMVEDISELVKDSNKMTRIYRAPEVFKSKQYNPQTVDIFGIGICLFMVICRDAPFYRISEDEDQKVILEACLENYNYRRFMLNPWQNLSQFFENHGIYLSQVQDVTPYEVIAWCLHPNPSARPTIEQLLQHPFLQEGPEDPAIVNALIQQFIQQTTD